MKNLKILMLVGTATCISAMAASAQAPATAPDVKETEKTVNPQPAPTMADKSEAEPTKKPASIIPGGETKPAETKNITLPAKNYDEHYKIATIKLPVNDTTPITIKKDEAAAGSTTANPAPIRQQHNN